MNEDSELWIRTAAVYTKEAALKEQLAEDKKKLAGVLEYVNAH